MERSLGAVRDLFGAPAPTTTSAATTSSNGSSPDWSGTAATRQQGAATALDDRRTTFTGADRGLDRWAAQTATDTATGRTSATTLLNSAGSTTRALAPYTATIPGRVALVSALTDHLGTANTLVADYAGTIPARQAALTQLAAQYGLPPTTPPPPPPPRPRPRPRRRRRRLPPTNRSGRFRMRGGFGGSPASLGKFPSSLGGVGGGGGGGGFPSLPRFGPPGWPRADGALLAPMAPGLAQNGTLKNAIVNAAAEKLGTIYKWGGKGGPADGGRVDCSGLTGYAYRKFGIDIGPDTFTQITKGVQVSPNDIQPADLIFCNFGSQGGNPGPGHVVMATGYGANSRVIEASTAGAPVAFGSMPSGRIVVKRILP